MSLPLRVIFMGTPAFACPALRALLDREVRPVLVVTQPDKPAGRDRHLQAPPLKELALEQGLPVIQPPTLKDPAVQENLRSLLPDVIAVAAFGQILPRAVLDIPPMGCVNVHASLLPRHRGASPVAYAIWEGDLETGVSIMKMEAGLDTGPVYIREPVPIPPGATTGSLEAALADVGARMLVAALEGIASGNLRPVPQDGGSASLAPKIRREQGLLDFGQGAPRLERQVRAFLPWPGTFFRHEGLEIKVTRAAEGARAPSGARPGQVTRTSGLSVSCGDGGSLALLELQRPGKKALPADLFLRGFSIAEGSILQGS